MEQKKWSATSLDGDSTFSLPAKEHTGYEFLDTLKGLRFTLSLKSKKKPPL